MMCPDTHKHAATTTCYHDHACRCPPCTEHMSSRARDRYRQKAYGRYEGHVELTGTIRRFQGLQVMGWRAEDVAAELGTHAPAVFRMLRQKWITPETRDRFTAATGALVRRGRGPSEVTVSRAKGKGWVSLLAWDDIDKDAEPAMTLREKRREGSLRGDELFTEIVWLAETGEHPHGIATALGKTLETLESYVRRHNRDDLLVHLKERKAA